MGPRTISRPAELTGTGLHTGAPGRVRLIPAEPGAGITFRRLDGHIQPAIPARLSQVAGTARRTALAAGVSRVETVEHLLAAISALEVCDLDIAVEGPEIPILDGSFAPFVDALLEAGLRGDGSPPAIDLEAPVDWTDGDAVYRAEPGDRLEIEVELVYREPVIGRQSAGGAVTADWFVREIAPARTFGFLEEVEPLQRRGLLAGARSDSAIVLAADRPLNTSLRWPNEFARHKLGDLLGDVALIGLRPRARIFASRPSHRGNIAFARALAAACGHPTED